MKWIKLGLIFSPASTDEKLISHAANPLPIHLEKDIYRFFYSGRDFKNRSSVGFVDIDILTKEIIYTKNEPVIKHGPSESFYSHGISIGDVYQSDGKDYILFMGWKITGDEHWRGDIGRLELTNKENLKLISDKPFIGVSDTDPVSLSYPAVYKDNNSFKMWYGSTVTWDSGNGEMLHIINHASSHNGESWDLKGLAVPFCLGNAQAFSRPTVFVCDKKIYHMWFSYRGKPPNKYRIGYAKSFDGIAWLLENESSGIDVSEKGWDSDMICYPYVFKHKDKIYMAYNGNGHGKTGFGLAVLEGW
ncbi:hypothetical protein [Endozoicomonas sp. 2B-B]